jgi:heme exporter protein C
MWKALHQLAIPERLYGLCGRWIPWLATLSALLLAVGLGWGFVYAPVDYQ